MIRFLNRAQKFLLPFRRFDLMMRNFFKKRPPNNLRHFYCCFSIRNIFVALRIEEEFYRSRRHASFERCLLKIPNDRYSKLDFPGTH